MAQPTRAPANVREYARTRADDDERCALKLREIQRRLVTVQEGAAAESEVGERTLDVVASDETVDRYGDVIVADGWQLEPFRRNPIALFAHDYAALWLGEGPVGVSHAA